MALVKQTSLMQRVADSYDLTNAFVSEVQISALQISVILKFFRGTARMINLPRIGTKDLLCPWSCWLAKNRKVM